MNTGGLTCWIDPSVYLLNNPGFNPAFNPASGPLSLENQRDGTFVINEVIGQEFQALQMFGRCSREGHNFSDGLVEALVGSVSQEVGEITVSHLVLVVPHLVVRGEEVVHGDLRAHLDPKRHSQVRSSMSNTGWPDARSDLLHQ